MLVKVVRTRMEEWVENAYSVKHFEEGEAVAIWSTSVPAKLVFNLSAERGETEDGGTLYSITLYSNGGIKLREYKARAQPHEMAGQGV